MGAGGRRFETCCLDQNPQYNATVDDAGSRQEELSPAAQKFSSDFPTFQQLGRTGASRYAPSIRGDKYGRVFTYSPDSITIDEYDKMRMDAQIRAGLMLVKWPVQQSSWSLQGEDKDINAFCYQVLDSIWATFLRHALLGLDFGFSVFEKIWTITYGMKVSQNQGRLKSQKQIVYPHAITLERMMPLDPKQLFLLAYRWSGEFAGVRQYAPNTALIPANKSFIFSNDQEFSEWHGVSRLKPCYPFWVFKNLMYEFTNVRYELWSMPMKKGRYPIGKVEAGRDGDGNPTYIENVDTMLNLLEEMRSNFAVAIPSNQYENGNAQWDVELMENGTNGSDHLQYIDHCNLMILKGLLVPQLALEIGGSGSYALAEQQIDFFMLNEQALMNQISEAITRQLLPQLVLYNFGKNAPVPKHSFTPIHGDMKEGLTQLLMQTLGSGQPVPVDEDNFMLPDYAWIADNLGVPVDMLTKDELDARNETMGDIQQRQTQMDPEFQAQQQAQQQQAQQPDTSQGGAPGVSEQAGAPEFGNSGAPNAGGDQQADLSDYIITLEELVLTA